MDILRHTCLHLVFGHAQRHNPCLHGHGQASGTSVFQFLQEEKNLVWEKWLVFKLENRCKLNTSLPLMSTWSRVSHMATPNCKEEWEILSLPRLTHTQEERGNLQLAIVFPSVHPSILHTILPAIQHTTLLPRENTQNSIRLLQPAQNSGCLSDEKLLHLVQCGSSSPENV